MKKIKSFISLILFLTALLVIPADASCNNDVTKAEEFMAVHSYPEAIALLEKRINDDPKDAEAHYQLGLCLVNTGAFSSAAIRFANAVKLEPTYQDKIGAEYKWAGDDALQSGSMNEALNLYRTAIKYQPDLRDRIAQGAFSQAVTFFYQNNFKLADSTFSVATAFAPSLEREASDIFFHFGNSVEGSRCIDYYRTASKYSNSHDHEIGERLVMLAKDPMASEADRKKYKEAAGIYLSDAEMSEAFPPDYELLDSGNYELLEIGKTRVVNIPDGLAPQKYFRIPMAGSSFEVSWTGNNTHFMLKTRGGKIITFEEIKKGTFVVHEKDFMVIPTINKPLNISIKPTGT